MSEILNVSLPGDESVADEQMLQSANLMELPAESATSTALELEPMTTEPVATGEHAETLTQDDNPEEDPLTAARRRVQELFDRMEARRSNPQAFPPRERSVGARPVNEGSPIYTLSRAHRGM